MSLFLCILIYYPSKPPLPPTPTSAISRTDYLKGNSNLSSAKRSCVSTFENVHQ